MKLRLYHHHDGARIAYREAGTGPPLGLLHSAGLSHKEFEPIVEFLTDRFRIVLPDLPLHGDSEDRPRHPYSPEWLTDVVAGFCREVLGPHPLVGGHDIGAELLLRAIDSGGLKPSKLVLMPNRLHGPTPHAAARRAWRTVATAASVPGLDRALARGATVVFRPSLGPKLSVLGSQDAKDLVRHAFQDVGGNGNRARSWAKAARRWPMEPQSQLHQTYGRIGVPVLLLWADRDRSFPLELAEEALGELPDAQLRVLGGTGYLIAYDDPVGVARELAAFCG